MPQILYYIKNAKTLTFARKIISSAVKKPGFSQFTKIAVLEPWTDTSRTAIPLKVATEEQARRGMWQRVNLMHRALHVESYEIFTEEIGGEGGGEKEGQGEGM